MREHIIKAHYEGQRVRLNWESDPLAKQYLMQNLFKSTRIFVEGYVRIKQSTPDLEIRLSPVSSLEQRLFPDSTLLQAHLSTP